MRRLAAHRLRDGDVAGDAGVDLIVLETHGRTGLRQVLRGSVAESVARAAACAVLTVKAPAPVAS